MRDVSTAGITVRELDDGREQRRIEHAPLVGIRPYMMLWFLQHIDQHLDWRGMKMLAYRYWHPTDHIFDGHDNRREVSRRLSPFTWA